MNLVRKKQTRGY